MSGWAWTSRRTFSALRPTRPLSAGEYDLDKMYVNAQQVAVNPSPPGAAVTPYSLADPSFSPPGTTNMVITMGAYGEPWLKLNPSEYLEAKFLQSDQAIQLAEIVAPDLRQHIEVMEIGTPVTNQRYTLNPGGSFIGFAENRFPGRAMQIPGKTPIEGLYMAGAWVNMGGGYMPSILNGYRAASDLLGEAGGKSWDFSDYKAAMIAATPNDQTIEESRAARLPTAQGSPLAGRVRLEVEGIIRETASASTLRLVAAQGSLPAFLPGQYLALHVNIDGTATSRAYSIASAPGKPYIDLTIRRKPGGFVSPWLLDKVQVGDVLEAAGPFGTFHHNPVIDSKNMVLLAGGSGITPMASIIRQAAEAGWDGTIHLLYGSRDPEDIIFKDELEEIAGNNTNIRVDFIISEPPDGYGGLCGLLDAQMIGSRVGSTDDKIFFICGPAQMHLLCTDALNQLGVPDRRIRRESYGPPDNPAELPGWPGLDPDTIFDCIEESSGRRIRVRAGEPLMNGLERAGLVVPSACRSGECTACRTKLVEGDVFVPENVAHRHIDDKAGYIHPCMSYPTGNLKIRL